MDGHLTDKACILAFVAFIAEQNTLAVPGFHRPIDSVKQPLERPVLVMHKTDIEDANSVGAVEQLESAEEYL